MKRFLFLIVVLFFVSCKPHVFSMKEIVRPLVNPNGNYLTVLLSYSTNKPSSLTVTKEGSGVVARSHGGNTHLLPVINMNPTEETKLTLQFISLEKSIFKKEEDVIEYFVTVPPTGNVPYTPEIKITKMEKTPHENEFYLVTTEGYSYMISKKGDMVWANDKVNHILYQLPNGHFLVTSKKPSIEYHSPIVYEIDLAGIIYSRYSYPNSFHHDIIPYKEGILGLSNSEPLPGRLKGPKTEDAIVYISNDSTLIKKWNAADLVEKNRFYVHAGIIRKDDWFHANAIGYSPEMNQIVVSSRHQSAIIGIDSDKEDDPVNWILAPKDYPSVWPDYLEKKRLTLENDEGIHGPHVVRFLQNGHLLTFDNGIEKKPKPYSRAVEYAIDIKNRSARRVREFDYGKKYFTPITGDVHELSPDRWAIFYAYFSSRTGLPSRLLEVNPDTQEILWEATIKSNPEMIEYRALPLVF